MPNQNIALGKLEGTEKQQQRTAPVRKSQLQSGERVGRAPIFAGVDLQVSRLQESDNGTGLFQMP